jgi:hypothetical protein
MRKILGYEEFKKINQELINRLSLYNYETFVTTNKNKQIQSEDIQIEDINVEKFNDFCTCTNENMTLIDFNYNFKDYIKGRGLSIINQGVIDYLFKEFSEEIKNNPAFYIYEVKFKLGEIRITTNSQYQKRWESEVTKIMQNTGFDLVN